ncbi:MAG: acetaldehyde dehydrogenase (acetylating) [Solirubrobacterales bacterium 70-9]|nr:MAG: acetaldehyde dehydrogenase (acetylating) [Solirubrobacterales bacterium 70-9]
MSEKVPCAILGSGNIGTDLMYKLQRSETLEPRAVIGIDPDSDGLKRAAAAGLDTSAEGVDWIVAHPEECRFVFEATSAGAHRANAPKIEAAGLQSIDLTPAKMGPGVVPVVNLEQHIDAADVNMITCGGQATIPMVAAVSQVTPVPYAEIVATIASLSAGPGTRESIDAFTRTTAKGLEEIGGAERGKAIIILNPADPPLMMRDTVFCQISPDADRDAIRASIEAMREKVATYVPGYRLRGEPQFEDDRVAIFVEVEGAADSLPAYAGNLDIMTAAAVAVGEALAKLRAPSGAVA